MKKWALVTGATAGIGESFTRLLAAEGFNLVLVARDEARLHERANGLKDKFGADSVVIVADLATESGCAKVEEFMAGHEIEVLINNAGFGINKAFTMSDLAKEEEILKVLVRTPMRLMHIALPAMKARNSGVVINVSSVAAFGTSAGNVSYCATKAWMNSFTLGLDVELRGINSPVKVQALCPGFTLTEFHDAMGVSRSPIPGFLWLKADYVVEQSLRTLHSGGPIVIPDWKYKFIVACMKILPGSITRAARPAKDKRV